MFTQIIWHIGWFWYWTVIAGLLLPWALFPFLGKRRLGYAALVSLILMLFFSVLGIRNRNALESFKWESARRGTASIEFIFLCLECGGGEIGLLFTGRMKGVKGE